MVINSNIEAQRTAGNLQRSQEAMQRSLNRLSSGSKIVNPSDDAAGVAVSSRLESELRRMESVMNNLSHATSFTQTQDGYLKNMDAAFTRMSELAMLASDGTKQSSDRNLYDEEFQHLMSYVRSARATDFNGVPLFNGSTVDVSIDEKGNSFAIGGIDLNASVYENAIKEPSWQLTSQVWATSTSGYVTNQSTYQLETTAYKLYTDLYYNDSTTPKWSTTDNGGTPYSAGSWVMNDGSTINENPPTSSVRTYTVNYSWEYSSNDGNYTAVTIGEAFVIQQLAPQYNTTHRKWFKDNLGGWGYITPQGTLYRRGRLSSIGVQFWNTPEQLTNLAVLTLPAPTSANTGYYRAKASNESGTTASSSKLLTIQ